MACNLPSKIARRMYNLSFYQFRIRLLEKAKIYKTEVLIKSEAYTSKTCTQCGQINIIGGYIGYISLQMTF